MPVRLLTAEPRDSYGRYAGTPSPNDLSRSCHLDDAELAYLAHKRGDHSRLGFALQLTTVRFLGTFLDDPGAVPHPVIQTLAKQLDIGELDGLLAYRDNRLRWAHTVEIRSHYGYREFVDPSAGFRLARWLYALCWTGTERPSVLCDRATAWLLTHKVLLPGVSVLERFVARLWSRVEVRLWRVLGRGVTLEQQAPLESLLTIPDGSRASRLDQRRTGPVTVSGPALVQALVRLQVVRDFGIVLPTAARIPPSRLASLARFAGTAKVTAINRLPAMRRLATLAAFVHCLEATAHG